MKIIEYERTLDGYHIAIPKVAAVTWVGNLWVLKLFSLTVCGIGWRVGLFF